MNEPVVKLALRMAAQERMIPFGVAVPQPTIREPHINRKSVDGPYLLALDGSLVRLSPWERLLTNLRIWNAWDIERRHFPLPLSGEAA